MKLVDTHTHIYLNEFDGDITGVMERAIDAGIIKMVLPACDAGSIKPMNDLHRAYPDLTVMAAGLHPTEIGDDADAQMKIIEQELRENRDRYVAIGEIGMDLYWDKSRRDQQIHYFSYQCRLATELDLPVIIHCREALDETLRAISSLPKTPRSIFHSFSGTAEDVATIRRIAGQDTYFGINGIVTFKKSRVAEALPQIGIEHLLLETDAPYLSPVPFRGKRNEPSYIRHTADFIAASLEISVDELADRTSQNAQHIFGSIL